MRSNVFSPHGWEKRLGVQPFFRLLRIILRFGITRFSRSFSLHAFPLRVSKPQKPVYSRVHHFSFPICVDRSTNGTRIRPWPYSANDIFQTLLGLRSRLRESAPHRSRDATGVRIARIVRNGKRCRAVNEFLLGGKKSRDSGKRICIV